MVHSYAMNGMLEVRALCRPMKTRADIDEIDGMFDSLAPTVSEIRERRIEQALDRAWDFMRNSPKYIAAVVLFLTAFYIFASMAGVLNDG